MSAAKFSKLTIVRSMNVTPAPSVSSQVPSVAPAIINEVKSIKLAPLDPSLTHTS